MRSISTTGETRGTIVRMDFEVKVADFSFEFCLFPDERFAFESVSAVLSDSIFLLFINYTLDETAWRTPHVDLTTVHLNEDMFHTLRILRTMWRRPDLFWTI